MHLCGGAIKFLRCRCSKDSQGIVGECIMQEISSKYNKNEDARGKGSLLDSVVCVARPTSWERASTDPQLVSLGNELVDLGVDH